MNHLEIICKRTILKMENSTLILKPNQIVRRIFLTTIFSLSVAGLATINHFFFLDRTDRTSNHGENLLLLIIFCVLSFLFLAGYILNLFVFKRKKVYTIMNSISDGVTIFCLISSIVILIVSQDNLIFNKEYLPLLITSSFTLLGFGLTITAILVTYIVNKIRTSESEKKIEFIFAYLLPYFLFFGAGLIYTISSLLELQFVEIGYFKIVVYKSLFYSGIQIFFLVYKIIDIIIATVFGDYSKTS